MHVLIYALTRGDDERDALGRAKSSVFDPLVGATANARNASFDYYTTFEEGEGSRVSGEGRYGPKPTAAQVTSEAGAEMLWRAWNFTRSDKHDDLNEIRDQLDDCTNDEILAGWHADSELALYDFNKVGESAGPSVRLYDATEYCFGVTSRHDLSQILAEFVGDIDIEPYETLEFSEEINDRLTEEFHQELVEFGTDQSTLSADGDTVPETTEDGPLWIVPADVHF